MYIFHGLKTSLVALTAGTLALLSAGTGSAGAAEGSLATQPVIQQTLGTRTVHVAVKSIYVHNDADKTVWGCGDFRYVDLKINGVERLDMDNGTGWDDKGISLDTFGPGGRGWQEYCSDHNYLMSPEATEGVNRFIYSGVVGSNLHLVGGAIEQDLGDNYTEGTGSNDVVVPAPGHYTDKVVMIEGSNSHGAMRLEVTIRVRTF